MNSVWGWTAIAVSIFTAALYEESALAQESEVVATSQVVGEICHGAMGFEPKETLKIGRAHV